MKRYGQLRRLQPDADRRAAGKTLRSFAHRPEAATRSLAHAPRASLPTSEGMDVLISLQYANGRIHEATYNTSDELSPDAEFDLHGRRWRVVGLTKRRRVSGDTPRTLCVSTGTNSRLPPRSASKS
jgi:hypothetical protein